VAPWKALALRRAPTGMADLTPRESVGGHRGGHGANGADFANDDQRASTGGCACGGDIANGDAHRGGIGKGVLDSLPVVEAQTVLLPQQVDASAVGRTGEEMAREEPLLTFDAVALDEEPAREETSPREAVAIVQEEALAADGGDGATGGVHHLGISGSG
jgi:hypothetical protein